jgi:predicted nucleic acid-binding protein
MLRVYLDTNVWCRPFDVPSERIIKEAGAFFKILEKAFRGELVIIGSVVLYVEVENTKEREIRNEVIRLIDKFAHEKIYDIPERMQREVKESIKLKLPDAAHIACAIKGECKYFITCDDEILSKRNEIKKRYRIEVCNPIEFVEEEKW